MGAASNRTLEEFRRRPTDRSRADLLVAAQGWAFPVAFGVLRQREDAEDVAQEVLLELIEALPTLRDTEHLRRWTYRASLHEAIDHRRRKQRRMKRERDSAQAIPKTERSFEEEDVTALHDCLVQLDDDAQELLVAYFFEGCTLAQLAGRRQCSTTHVWNQLERGKSALARRLERAGYAAAAPLSGAWLEAVPRAPTTPPVSTEVLARAQALTVSSPTAGTALGGILVALNKTSVALPLLGLLCFGLGVGATRLLGGANEGDNRTSAPPVASKIEADSVNDSSASHDREIAALREQNRQLEARLRAQPAPSVASDETPTTSGEPASPLLVRLESLHEWMAMAREKVMQLERGQQSPELEAYQATLIQELGERTAGLRELMISDPETLFAFLNRDDVDDDYIAMSLHVLIKKQHRSATSYTIDEEAASSLPPEFMDGLLDLCEKSDDRLRMQGLETLMTLTDMEDRHLDRLRAWIDSPDPQLAGKAFRAFNKGAQNKDHYYDETLRHVIDEALRTAPVEHEYLLSGALEALEQYDDPEALTTVLDILEHGRYPHLDLAGIQQAQERVIDHPERLPDYARALATVGANSTESYVRDQIVRQGLRLTPQYARIVLEGVVRNSDQVRAELILDMLKQLEGGQLTTAQLQERFASGLRELER